LDRTGRTGALCLLASPEEERFILNLVVVQLGNARRNRQLRGVLRLVGFERLGVAGLVFVQRIMFGTGVV